jgi:hypothetical protein
MNNDGEFMGGLIIGCIICFIFFWYVRKDIDDSWREQIEQHGCGGFYLDSNRVRQWDWKSNQGEK